MNRHTLNNLLYFRRRKRQLEALRLWYESELQDIKRYADAQSTLFIQEFRDHFIRNIPTKEHSEAVLRGSLAAIRIEICNLIQLNQQAKLTREYSIRLYDITSRLGYEQTQMAAKLMRSEVAATEQMRAMNYPVSELYGWLRLHKRA